MKSNTKMLMLLAGVGAFASGCGGSSGGGGDARTGLENDTNASMADRVIFEMKAQANTYERNSHTFVDIPAFGDPSESASLGCQDFDQPDESFIRSLNDDPTGGICAFTSSQTLCYGQADSALAVVAEDGESNTDVFMMTSDRYDTVASVQVAYTDPGNTTVDIIVVAAFAPKSGCDEDQLDTTFNSDDIQGDWNLRFYEMATASLPEQIGSESAICDASGCSSQSGFSFSVERTEQDSDGLAYIGSATFQGGINADTVVAISPTLTTLSGKICAANTSTRSILRNCVFMIGERQ